MNNTILIFNRKVIPIMGGEKGAARVETEIAGFIEGEPFEIGFIKFPSKQTWTKFWGAMQRGAVNIPDFEVKMQNVLPEDTEVDEASKSDETSKSVEKKWVGNQLQEVGPQQPK